MAQIIIDSGGSKSDWALIGDESNVEMISTIGLNPAYTAISPALETIICDQRKLRGQFDKIHFYGAGCSNTDLKRSVKDGFNSFFTNADIYVYTDVLAACKALCQHSPGIIGILGTGSNSAFYDGQIIKEMTPSGGFILGDEGSGFAIGRDVLRRYIRSELQESDELVIHKHIGFNKNEVISWVYSADKPNKTISSVSEVLPKCSRILQKTVLTTVFSDFVQKKLLPLSQKYPHNVHFTGSVAFHYKEQLTDVLNSFSLQVGKIIKKPITGLVKYHLNEEKEN